MEDVKCLRNEAEGEEFVTYLLSDYEFSYCFRVAVRRLRSHSGTGT